MLLISSFTSNLLLTAVVAQYAQMQTLQVWLFAWTYTVGIIEVEQSAPLSEKQHLVATWPSRVIIVISVLLMCLNAGFFYSYYTSNYSQIIKRQNMYITSNITDQIWMLVVMCLAASLISYNIYLVVKLVGKWNLRNLDMSSKERYKLNPYATMLHLCLLVVVIITGVLQLQI